MQMKRLFLGGLLILLASGCMNSKFVYKPSELVAGGPKLPVKIAVLPFADGTENFTVIGSVVWLTDIRKFNLAKVGEPEAIDALPPDFWAKAFAEELAASGRFESVRFLYDRSEATDEAFLVEGTLQKAYLEHGALQQPHEFALAFRATKRVDGRPAWEKSVGKSWKYSPGIYESCGYFSQQCGVDRRHDSIRRVMQEMFAEAGADLASTLAPLAGGGAGGGANPTGAPPAEPAPSSVDETIEGILGTP